MPMNPMAPKTMAPVAAFRLLADLNVYMALSHEERESVLADYVAATEQRQLMLDAMAADKDAAAVDRKAAARGLDEAGEAASAALTVAAARTKEIVDAANSQAESINKTVAENVARAKTQAETAANEARERDDAIRARDDACEVREANAFKEREDAVAQREDEVARREREAEDLHALGLSTKEGYEALLRQINALSTGAGAEVDS